MGPQQAVARGSTFKSGGSTGKTIDAMGWLRLVGSLKLYVSFAEYSLFSWALLH